MSRLVGLIALARSIAQDRSGSVNSRRKRDGLLRNIWISGERRGFRQLWKIYQGRYPREAPNFRGNCATRTALPLLTTNPPDRIRRDEFLIINCCYNYENTISWVHNADNACSFHIVLPFLVARMRMRPDFCSRTSESEATK